MLLIGGVLAIWPVVAFVLLLARRVLFRDARDGLEVRQRFYRSLRWTLVLGGVLAALVILTSTLPLSPALADLVDRSAMLCVLLIALPGLQLRSLILALAGGRERAGLVSASGRASEPARAAGAGRGRGDRARRLSQSGLDDHRALPVAGADSAACSCSPSASSATCA